jgi:hypothetical protein
VEAKKRKAKIQRSKKNRKPKKTEKQRSKHNREA